MSYSTLTNQKDGVVPAAEDNKDDGVVASDADDARYTQNIDPASIKAGTNSGYTQSPATIPAGDPRMA